MIAPPSRILIVEDDSGLAELLGDALRGEGLQVAAVESGSDCLAWLAGHEVDLLLTDYALPDMTASALVAELSRVGRGCPFVVITGHGDEEVAVELMKQGALDYLVKDARLFVRLPGVVRRVLGIIATQRRLAAAEDSLRESEERFRHVSTASSDMVYSCSCDGDGPFALDWLAGAVDRICGTSNAEFLARGCWGYLVVEEDLPQFRAKVAGLAASETGFCELRLHRPDGSVIWVASRARCVADPKKPGRLRLHGALEDITARKQSEAALKASEHRYHMLMDNVAFPVTVTSLENGLVLFANQRAIEFFGVENTTAVGLLARDFWVDLDLRARLVRELETMGEYARREVEMRTVRDERVWVEMSAKVIEFEGARAAFAVYNDITARKAAKAALEASAARFRALFDHSPSGIFEEDFSAVKLRLAEWRAAGITDLAQYLGDHPEEVAVLASLVKVLLVNQRSAEILGVPTTENLPMDLPRYFSAESLPVFREEILALARGEMLINLEIPIVNAGGEARRLDLTVCLIPGYEESWARVVVTFSDITERQRTQAALREASQFNGQIITGAHEGIIVYGSDLRFRVWNPYMEELSGRPAREVLGRLPAEVFPFLQEKGLLARLEQALRGEIPSPAEFDFNRAGKRAWVVDTSAPLRNADGQVIGVIGTVQDITARKLVEETQAFLLECGLAAPEGEYFKLLARFLAETTGLEHVCIDRLEGEDLIAYTLAVYHDGKFRDNVSYALKDTPCGQVVGDEVCHFPREVQRLFPGDPALRELTAESYVGIVLRNTQGRAIGLIALLGFKALEDARPVLALLKQVAPHAAAEIERRQADAALRASLREKEALLKEVHHRVKNNLQVVTSLLRLEAARSTAPGTQMVLREMQGRIRSMALLHESLYRSGNLAQIDLAYYLKQLAVQLFRAHGAALGAIRLHTELSPVPIEMDQAVPCGLIVNELLTNSLKHAFPTGGAGEVRLGLEVLDAEARVRLHVGDNGVGLPAGFDPTHAATLGLQLVSDLSRQLRGTLEIAAPGHGAGFTLTFAVVRSLPPVG